HRDDRARAARARQRAVGRFRRGADRRLRCRCERLRRESEAEVTDEHGVMTRRNHARSEGSNASMRGIAPHGRTSGPQRSRSALMFATAAAGGLPKPGWLAEADKLWRAWRPQGAALAGAKRDATVLWLKEQEQAGLDTVTDGERSRQHFV